MLAHCGLPVLNLKRLAYGACTLGGRPQHVEMRSRYDLDTGDCLARFLHRMHAYHMSMEHAQGAPQPVAPSLPLHQASARRGAVRDARGATLGVRAARGNGPR